MSFFEKLGSLAIRVAGNQVFLQSRLPVSCITSHRCARSVVNADDLRSLPEKPKKPLSPYFRFMAEMRPDLKKSHPDCKVTELAKFLGDKWEKFPQETKQKYLEDYRKDMIVYVDAKNKYEMQLTDDQKLLLKRAKEEMVAAKENRKLKKKMKDLGKPRRPPSAFVMFFSSRQSARGDTPYKEWVSKLGKEWSDMPPELKATYHRQFSSAMESHRRQIHEWEERMIRMGHIDLVRSEALIEPKVTSRKPFRTRPGEKNK
ncbi:transcription factor A, mitochondrial-like isoform X1 [Ischnura elegans]|uniref:transcription factor A, mitochondrial-like isoform X1 n=2 Tax=Ischnura elegans TaxID=197161 RepID=UPI001ED8AB1C|nr:transcription factor A, mitochondrial-like isoform X1 [Ischnura elegans]XP_046407622.1 transcription factor A, mitochondrial-like isoform X1 [Ischnura elegans]